jgi:hypothetical protein
MGCTQDERAELLAVQAHTSERITYLNMKDIFLSYAQELAKWVQGWTIAVDAHLAKTPSLAMDLSAGPAMYDLTVNLVVKMNKLLAQIDNLLTLPVSHAAPTCVGSSAYDVRR